MTTHATKLFTAVLTLAATVHFASSATAGEIKKVGRTYKASEHNGNYKELNRRTRTQAKNITQQKNKLNDTVLELRAMNLSLNQRIDNLDIPDIRGLEQQISDVETSVNDLARVLNRMDRILGVLTVDVERLEDGLDDVRDELDDVQQQLSRGAAKAGFAADATGRFSRLFNTLGDLPTIEFQDRGNSARYILTVPGANLIAAIYNITPRRTDVDDVRMSVRRDLDNAERLIVEFHNASNPGDSGTPFTFTLF